MAKKAHKAPAIKAGASANSKAGLKSWIKKSGVSLPLARDVKGRARSLTVRELKDIKSMLKELPSKGIDVKKKGQEVADYAGYYAEARRKQLAEAKKKGEPKPTELTGKKVKEISGIIPKIKKQEGYGYTQAGSAGNFILGERSLGRKLVVRRNGKDTVIDSADMELKIIKAVKGARSAYRAKLRKDAKEGKAKISDVMFIAHHREKDSDGNMMTVLDIDHFEYGGLSKQEINETGLS